MGTAAPEAQKVNKPDHVPDDLVRDFDYIFDAGIVARPHSRMAEIAATMPPLFWTPHYGGHWIACSRSTLTEIATHPEIFSSANRGIPPSPNPLKLIPLTMDPPVHSAYRVPINPLVSVRAVAPLESAIRRSAPGAGDIHAR